MKIIGLIPIKNGNENEFIIRATEDELDTISGVKGKTHIGGRYTVGAEITADETYDRLNWINKHLNKLPQTVAQLRTLADNLEKAVPEQEGE